MFLLLFLFIFIFPLDFFSFPRHHPPSFGSFLLRRRGAAVFGLLFDRRLLNLHLLHFDDSRAEVDEVSESVMVGESTVISKQLVVWQVRRIRWVEREIFMFGEGILSLKIENDNRRGR